MSEPLSVDAEDAVPEDESFSLGALGRTTLLLGVATVVGQLFVLGRELVVGARVGLSSELDALLVTLVPTLMIATVLSNGTSAALIPAYLGAKSSTDPQAGGRLVGAVVTWVALLGSVLAVGLVLLANLIIPVFGPGLEPSAVAMGVALMPIVAGIGVFTALATILIALCQAEKRVTAVGIGVACPPLVSFAVVIALWPTQGLTALAIGLLVGPLVTTLVLAAAAFRGGFLPRPRLTAPVHDLRAFRRHAVPLTLSAMILQVNLYSDRAIASLTGTGSVSALRYGQQLAQAPIWAADSAWNLAVYPTLAQAAQGSDVTRLGRGASRSLGYVLVAFIPIAFGLAALAPLVVDVALRRGAFDAAAAAATSTVVAAFAPIAVALMAQPVLVGAHNARQRGRVLLAAGTMNATCNLGLNIAFGAWIGVAGVALSSSVTGFIVLVFLAHRLGVHEPGFDPRGPMSVAARCAFAAAVPAVPAALLAWSMPLHGDTLSSAAILSGLAAVGLAVYVGLALLLRVGEMSVLMRRARMVTARALGGRSGNGSD